MTFDTDNEIRVEGAKAIGDALKTNTSLKKLDLEKKVYQ